MKYYKWFANRKPVYGEGEYVLDGGWQPSIEGKLKVCDRGYHVCREHDLAHWRGTELAEVEIDPDGALEFDNKVCVRSFRVIRMLPWTREDMIDCAREDARIAAANAKDCDARNAAIRAAIGADGAADGAIRHAAHAAVRAAACAEWAAAARADANAAYAADAAYSAAAQATERKRQERWILKRVRDNQKEAQA